MHIGRNLVCKQIKCLHHVPFRVCGIAPMYYSSSSKGVPTASYTEKGQRSTKDAQRTVLKVEQSAAKTAFSDAGIVHRKAVPFDRTLVPKLTPTLKSFTLEGKVALVTGGARGLGWNMSQALCEAGAKAIAILDVRQDLGDDAAAELHATTGTPTQFYHVDVRDADSIAEVTANVVRDFGSIDIVVNSAGVVDSNIKAETYDANQFRNLLDINLTGSFLVAQAAARHMMASAPGRQGGSIIFVSSIAGSRVLHPQQQCAYNASKAAVTQVAKSLAAEWAPHGIRVNAIAPGYMDTALNREAALQAHQRHWANMTPMGRLGQPAELNGLAVFLASDASGFVTGANIYVDGGYAVY